MSNSLTLMSARRVVALAAAAAAASAVLVTAGYAGSDSGSPLGGRTWSKTPASVDVVAGRTWSTSPLKSDTRSATGRTWS